MLQNFTVFQAHLTILSFCKNVTIHLDRKLNYTTISSEKIAQQMVHNVN